MNTYIERRTFVTASFAIFLAGIAAPLLGGCSEKSPSSAVAVVLDKGATSSLADGSASCVKRACWPVVKGGGHLSIVIASSNPETVCDVAVPPPENPEKAALEKRWSKEDAFFSSARQIDDLRPAHEEIDLLRSIKLAANALRAEDAQACETLTLYVAASGLSTAGLIDMTGKGKFGDVLEWPDYGELVKAIAADTSHGAIEADGLPWLTGVHVIWAGAGQLTGGAQAAIPDDKRAAIKDLWASLLTASGAKFDPMEDFVAAPAAEGAEVDRSYLPMVTPIVFDESFAETVITFDENVLGFEIDSDVYRDGSDYVEAVLSPYADALKSTGATVVVLGCTADDGSGLARCRELGRRRAQRVKDDLVAMGVDDGQLIVCSAGCEGASVLVGTQLVDFYQDNWNPDGTFNGDVAANNRSISIIRLDLAGDIIARFSI